MSLRKINTELPLVEIIEGPKIPSPISLRKKRHGCKPWQLLQLILVALIFVTLCSIWIANASVFDAMQDYSSQRFEFDAPAYAGPETPYITNTDLLDDSSIYEHTSGLLTDEARRLAEVANIMYRITARHEAIDAKKRAAEEAKAKADEIKKARDKVKQILLAQKRREARIKETSSVIYGIAAIHKAMEKEEEAKKVDPEAVAKAVAEAKAAAAQTAEAQAQAEAQARAEMEEKARVEAEARAAAEAEAAARIQAVADAHVQAETAAKAAAEAKAMAEAALEAQEEAKRMAEAAIQAEVEAKAKADAASITAGETIAGAIAAVTQPEAAKPAEVAQPAEAAKPAQVAQPLLAK